MLKTALPTLTALTLMATSAHADLAVRFVEGAPKDRFVFANQGDCTLSDAELVLDLSGSSAGLIFDVTARGAGVEVFQPLELVAGAETLKAVPQVRDGDNIVRFQLRELAQGAELAFTIDVDDTTGGREITVNGSEITGALVSLAKGDWTAQGTFADNAKASVDLDICKT